MSAKKRILFIANEMSPYLELTEFSEIVNKLAIKANDNNFEVRCIMPRFGSSMNAVTGFTKWSGFRDQCFRDNDDLPLQIKVASLPAPASGLFPG
jgi:starch synthase